MKLEFTSANKGSFWDFNGIRLRIVGWDQNRTSIIIVENEHGDMWELQNDIRNWRRLEGCDSFEWVEEVFPQYRAVYNPLINYKFAYHRRDSETKTVSVLKDGTEKAWDIQWCKNYEQHYPLITEAEAFALLDPTPVEETFPQYWTILDTTTSKVAYVVRHTVGRYSSVYKDGRAGKRFAWNDFDSEQRKRLTEAEAKALIDPQPVEASDDWVEIEGPEHALPGTAYCNHGRWGPKTWVEVDVDTILADKHGLKFRCLRKDLKPSKTTRTVILREYVQFDDPGYETILWAANDPRGWNRVHETGRTKEIEVPV